MYGPRTDALNAGTPTDRLIAEWDVESRTRSALDAQAVREFSRLIRTAPREDGRLEPSDVSLDPSQSSLLLEIPPDINQLRTDSPPLAERWRQAVRRAFLEAFAAGYRATGFVRDEADEPRRAFYVLQRD